MKSRFWHRRRFTPSQWILLLTLAALTFGNVMADDAPFGTYSGECTLNNEPTRVELEIVRNEKYPRGSGGADAILSLLKSGETAPRTPITLSGGYRDVPEPRRRGDRSPPKMKRQFDFSASVPSEAFGGSWSVKLEEAGAALTGTLSLQKRQRPDLSGGGVESVPITLTRNETPQSSENVTGNINAGEMKIDSSDIAGVYAGTFTAERRQFYAELQLNREGETALRAVFGFSASASQTQPLGSFKLKGTYDPKSNTLKLSSDGDLASSGGITLATVDGRFDPASGKVQAQASPDGTLELTRDTKRTAELQVKNGAATKQLKEGAVSLAQAKTDEDRRVVIVRWFNRLKSEYPDIDLHHTVLDQLYPKVLNLFGDGDFIPVFGKPFDAMSREDLNYVKESFRRLFGGPETRELLDGFGDFLERPFVLPNGSFSYNDVVPQLAFRRTVQKTWHQTMDRLKTLSPTSADYDELLSLEKKGTGPFKDLWPSEFKQFQETVDSTKRRLADGAATERLDSAMSNANGLDGARSLSQWADQQKELLEYVLQDTRQKLNAHLNTKIGEFVEPLLREEANAVADFGEGAGAVMAGNKWYRHLNDTYGFATANPAFQAAVERLKARREGDLSAAQPAIMAEMEKQSTERGVDGVKASYLSIPGDSETDAGRAVAAAASARKKIIQVEKAMAYYSPHERQWLRSEGTLAIPKDAGPPDEDDLRVAIARTLQMMGGNRTDAFTIEWSNQITKMFGAYPIIKIEKVDELACSPTPGGYRVSYRVHMNIDYPDSLKQMMNSQPSLGGSMLQGLTQRINGPHGTQEARFELGEHGWWCPTMAEGGVDNSD